MPITPGTRLGPYEIVAPLGAGGMGEVWRGRDTRLDRSVAIKVLPSELSQNAQLKMRFEREARVISSLTDPHICTLYDVGHEGGIDYLVMELVEGETLSDRLLKGPMPIDQVLRYGIEIAGALDKAHRQGIIHRDLKPSNIMLTKSGAKLLDFGLARIAAGEGPVIQLSNMETAQRQLTEEGAIVGTFQYMAPEQLDGTAADARTDIFAFGAVLYEMATGRRAFEGKTKSSLIAAIIDREPPPISSIQPLTPPAFERVVKECLAKDPENRWQSARDIANELRWIQEAGSGAGVAAPVVHRRRLREGTAWAIALALLITTAVFAWLWNRAGSVPQRRVEASILPPDGTEFMFGTLLVAFVPVISPDGTQIVFSARDTEGRNLLWVRRLDSGTAHPLPGTDLGTAPFWSPDSRHIGFFSSGKLRRIAASGGPSQVIADAGSARGGTWNQVGDIIFAPLEGDVLHRVSADGGAVVRLAQLDAATKELSHRWPSFLPDGKHFLYQALTFGSAQDRGRIYVGSLESKERKLVAAVNSSAVYSATGHVLYCRERTLIAQPFDANRLAITGEPAVIANDIFFGHVAAFSVSQNGILSYFKGKPLLSHFVWRDRTGKELGIAGGPGDYLRPQISHDGRRFSYELRDSEDSSDIWIYDSARQTSNRLTFGAGRNTHAIWSPDDRFIVYLSEDVESGTRMIVRRASNGLGPAETLLGGLTMLPNVTDWSPDGRYLIFHTTEPRSPTGLDIAYFSIADRKIRHAVQTPALDCCARVSPDGRWLAYSSAVSGRTELHVQPFPVATGRFQITTSGGTQPRWSADGRELFFNSPDSNLMVVNIQTGETVEAGVPKPLFSMRLKGGGWSWDASSDGRFVVNETVQVDTSSLPITVVLNWNADAKK
ncbi:MAG: protein kinase domain-containing protein [Thermoanaerobaculia bacterium]